MMDSSTNSNDDTRLAPISKFDLGLFGQLVIGPPGCGKTTYCAAMHKYLTQLGRDVAIINLDPANDLLPYPCSINLNDLIRLDEVMDYLGLGPNGGLIYCMDYLYENRDWLAHRLIKLKEKNSKIYLIFDLPGQVELYTHLPSMKEFVSYLVGKPSKGTPNKSLSETISTNGLHLNLTALHLVDSHYCSDAGKFIASVLTSLSAMVQLGLPHVNILSKIDLIEQFGGLDFNLDFFTEVLDLQFLIDYQQQDRKMGQNPIFKKYARFNEKLVGLIQDRSLVQFLVLDIQDRTHLERVMRYTDRGNGYVFGPNEQHNLQTMMHSASGIELCPDFIGMAQEKYVSKSQTGETFNDLDIDLFT